MGDLGGWEYNLTEEECLPSPNPLPTIIDIGDYVWAEAECRTKELISLIQPSTQSENQRQAVIQFIQQLVHQYVGCEVFAFGSVPLKTYLPDGDIDLTAFSKQEEVRSMWENKLLFALQEEERRKDAEFRVTDVQFINAEVKLVKCLVENIIVDISFNQLGGLYTLCFLENVNQLIGRNHLFKRSIILVKSWCYYESRILGAHHGLLSTYALETLVLYIFHLFHSKLHGPLEVLFMFLDYFSKFDWDNYCVSLQGPVPKQYLPQMAAEPPQVDGELLLSEDFLKHCIDMYSGASIDGNLQRRPFSSKHLNVVDPLRENNNLGRSVSRANFYRIRSAFGYGARKLAKILKSSEGEIASGLNSFFPITLERHRDGKRSDVPASQLPKPNSFIGSKHFHASSMIAEHQNQGTKENMSTKALPGNKNIVYEHKNQDSEFYEDEILKAQSNPSDSKPVKPKKNDSLFEDVEISFDEKQMGVSKYMKHFSLRNEAAEALPESSCVRQCTIVDVRMTSGLNISAYNEQIGFISGRKPAEPYREVDCGFNRFVNTVGFDTDVPPNCTSHSSLLPGNEIERHHMDISSLENSSDAPEKCAASNIHQINMLPPGKSAISSQPSPVSSLFSATLSAVSSDLNLLKGSAPSRVDNFCQVSNTTDNRCMEISRNLAFQNCQTLPISQNTVVSDTVNEAVVCVSSSEALNTHVETSPEVHECASNSVGIDEDGLLEASRLKHGFVSPSQPLSTVSSKSQQMESDFSDTNLLALTSDEKKKIDVLKSRRPQITQSALSNQSTGSGVEINKYIFSPLKEQKAGSSAKEGLTDSLSVSIQANFTPYYPSKNTGIHNISNNFCAAANANQSPDFEVAYKSSLGSAHPQPGNPIIAPLSGLVAPRSPHFLASDVCEGSPLGSSTASSSWVAGMPPTSSCPSYPSDMTFSSVDVYNFIKPISTVGTISYISQRGNNEDTTIIERLVSADAERYNKSEESVLTQKTESPNCATSSRRMGWTQMGTSEDDMGSSSVGILSGDIASHFSNLAYGRWCQDPICQGSVPPFPVSHSYVPGQHQWKGLAQPFYPLVRSTPHFNGQLVACSSPPIHSGYQGLHVRPVARSSTVGKTPRPKSGTGTYLPNMNHFSCREKQSLGKAKYQNSSYAQNVCAQSTAFHQKGTQQSRNTHVDDSKSVTCLANADQSKFAASGISSYPPSGLMAAKSTSASQTVQMDTGLNALCSDAQEGQKSVAVSK